MNEVERFSSRNPECRIDRESAAQFSKMQDFWAFLVSENPYLDYSWDCALRILECVLKNRRHRIALCLKLADRALVQIGDAKYLRILRVLEHFAYHDASEDDRRHVLDRLLLPEFRGTGYGSLLYSIASACIHASASRAVEVTAERRSDEDFTDFARRAVACGGLEIFYPSAVPRFRDKERAAQMAVLRSLRNPFGKDEVKR